MKRALVVIALMLGSSTVVNAAPVVGSPDTATADPRVPRPRTRPCVVTLFTEQEFANFDPKLFRYAPPAACPGPWAKVVFTADFRVTAGRQFDRTANVWIGGTNVYFGTTMQPSRTVSRTWHVERDLTEYATLLTQEQAGKAILGNLVNETYTGILYGTARIELYPKERNRPVPAAADVVVPFSEQADGGTVLLATTNDRLARAVTLPRNVDRAYLEVYAQSQHADEFWWTCVPSERSEILQSCGGTAFREAQVTIDGEVAGIAPVYPWIYTGGIDPYMWRPIPGVQALSFEPYRVDLTPFAAILSDGGTHEVSIRVLNANNYFMVTASLLVYLDRAGTQTTGRILVNTFGPAAPSVEDEITDGAAGPQGTIVTTSTRQGTIQGLVTTSRGTRKVTVQQRVDFESAMSFHISPFEYVQEIEQATSISRVTLTTGTGTVETSSERHWWPLAVTYAYVQNDDGTAAQTTTVDQRYRSDQLETAQGRPTLVRSVSNAVGPASTIYFNADGAAVRNESTSAQAYTELVNGACYQRSVAMVNGIVSSVVDGGVCAFEPAGASGDRSAE